MTAAAATAQRQLLHMTANGSLGPDGEGLLAVRRGRVPTPRTPTAGASSTACGGPARLGLVVGLIPRRLREAGLLARVCNRFVPLIGSSPR
ncbi:hypothetical protein [Streptomyces sp. NPDC007991]|uniref:hypothetical protein n=1 Tax=Streptomyces sp. NPDC007991 TaxID=3364803 RepID=UPI0036E0B84E